MTWVRDWRRQTKGMLGDQQVCSGSSSRRRKHRRACTAPTPSRSSPTTASRTCYTAAALLRSDGTHSHLHKTQTHTESPYTPCSHSPDWMSAVQRTHTHTHRAQVLGMCIIQFSLEKFIQYFFLMEAGDGLCSSHGGVASSPVSYMMIRYCVCVCV